MRPSADQANERNWDRGEQHSYGERRGSANSGSEAPTVEARRAIVGSGTPKGANDVEGDRHGCGTHAHAPPAFGNRAMSAMDGKRTLATY